MKFDLVEIHAQGYPMIKSEGIDVTDKTTDKPVVIGNSRDPIDVSMGDRNITFKLLNPKDQPQLSQLYLDCIGPKQLKFTMICIGYDEEGNLKNVERLDNCWCNEYDRNLNAKQEFKITFNGQAMARSSIDFQIPAE